MLKILVVLLFIAAIFGIVAHAMQSKSTPSPEDVEPTPMPDEEKKVRKPSPHSGVSATLLYFKNKEKND